MGSQKDVFKSGEVREQDDFCFTQAEYKRLQEYAENLNGLEKYFRQIIGLKQYDEFGFPIEEESETPITDAMRAWDEEEKESETPITDAMRTWNEEKKTIKTDPYIKALLDRLIKSGGILIPSQHLKIQQGDFQKIANVPSEASIKAGYKAHSLEGVYERRNIKMSQIQKANQVIHESSQNKDEQQNEQEGGTDYDQH